MRLKICSGIWLAAANVSQALDTPKRFRPTHFSARLNSLEKARIAITRAAERAIRAAIGCGVDDAVDWVIVPLLPLRYVYSLACATMGGVKLPFCTCASSSAAILKYGLKRRTCLRSSMA